VLYTKEQGDKSFVIVDAGMNDLIRPAMYDATHPLWPARQRAATGARLAPLNVVGPICETGDFLARERPPDGQIQHADFVPFGLTKHIGNLL